MNHTPCTTICSLSRLHDDELMLSCNLLNRFKQSRIQLLGVDSEFHLHNKIKISFADLLKKYTNAVLLLHDESDSDISIVLEDASRGSIDFLHYQIEHLLNLGIKKITYADTIGCLTPFEMQSFISATRQRFGKDIFISVHCHNDLGLATANSLAAILSDADEVQGTFIGAGERCGNMSIEEVCSILTLKDNYRERFSITPKLKSIVKSSYEILDILELEVPLYKPIIGKYAFATSAGIHQNGILKNRLNYSFFDPKVIGRDFEFVVNRLSSKKLDGRTYQNA